MLNSLDPDQARHFVGPDLGPTSLQRLSARGQSVKYRTTSDTTSDTTFWLKSISFGSNFFYLAKVLATTNSEPG